MRLLVTGERTPHNWSIQAAPHQRSLLEPCVTATTARWYLSRARISRCKGLTVAETKKDRVSKKAKRVDRAKRRQTSKTDEHLDGCDVKIEDADATPDEDLPAAEGGVA